MSNWIRTTPPAPTAATRKATSSQRAASRNLFVSTSRPSPNWIQRLGWLRWEGLYLFEADVKDFESICPLVGRACGLNEATLEVGGVLN